jgi:hypothetical protein
MSHTQKRNEFIVQWCISYSHPTRRPVFHLGGRFCSIFCFELFVPMKLVNFTNMRSNKSRQANIREIWGFHSDVECVAIILGVRQSSTTWPLKVKVTHSSKMSVHVIHCHIPEDLNSLSGKHFLLHFLFRMVWNKEMLYYQCCTTFL